MTQRLFYDGDGRAVTGPDLLFEDRQKLIGLDVKTFDCRPYKRMFAISEARHIALHGQCAGYVGLIGPRYARRACLTKVIPYESVSDWERGILRKLGPPSHHHPIHEVMKRYAPAYPLEHGSSDVYSHAQIMDLARQSGPGSPIHSLCIGSISSRTTISRTPRIGSRSRRRAYSLTLMMRLVLCSRFECDL